MDESPVLMAFARVLDGETRALIDPVVPDMAGTASDGRDVIRGYLLLDWLIRECVPAWWDGSTSLLTEDATALRELLPIVDLSRVHTVVPILRRAQQRLTAVDRPWLDVTDGSIGFHGIPAYAAFFAADIVVPHAAAAVRPALQICEDATLMGVFWIDDMDDVRFVLEPVVSQLRHSAGNLFHRLIFA